MPVFHDGLKRPGTYLLFLKSAASREIAIGRLGRFVFPAGYYTYVGSAFGPGGLKARLSHHLYSPAGPRWHIDYLKPEMKIDRIWFSTGGQHQECLWARTLAELSGSEGPIERFGSSDCKCPAHLFHFKQIPCVDSMPEGSSIEVIEASRFADYFQVTK